MIVRLSRTLRQLFILGKYNLPVDFRSRHLLSAGRKSSLLGVPPAGSRPFLYIPQESSAFRSNQLKWIKIIISEKAINFTKCAFF
jgi:hypothetical protein